MTDHPLSASSPADPLHTVEALSAYLDGELDADAHQRVEHWLETDPQARLELRRLQQAWDLLERLPAVEVGPSFTHSTVAMIAVQSAAEMQPESRFMGGRWLRGALFILMWLAMAGVGFALVRLTVSDTSASLVADLPVLEHLEAYRQTPDLEFLRKLDAPGLFHAEESRHAP